MNENLLDVHFGQMRELYAETFGKPKKQVFVHKTLNAKITLYYDTVEEAKERLSKTSNINEWILKK